MNEQWRAVPGYEGWYSVSSLGQIRRDHPGSGTKVGRLVKPRKRRHSPNTCYMTIRLWRDNRPRHFFLHRLVAAAFLGPCPDGFQVNHKDFDTTNNALGNLEYITEDLNRRQQRPFARPWTEKTRFRPGEAHPAAKLTATQVLEIRALAATGTSHLSIARRYGVAGQTVHVIVHRRGWKHI